MGEVYAAADENLDRDVAIKVLGAAVDAEPHRRRFLREARLAARLNHPNIASIHEVGDSDGRLYIVMELLEGEPLRTLLNTRKLTIEESLTIGRDIARALARAHAGDVIHRDIKPENIFITYPSPDVVLAKVLDFGLARDEVRANSEESTGVTVPGQACGTAGYLAPEQARGLAVDIRADIFSFGAVMYEILTSKRAFDGPNHLARMLAVVKSEPEPLRARVPDIKPELEELVARCLAKSPADRYPDGASLLSAIEKVARTSYRLSAGVDLSARNLDSVLSDEDVSTQPHAPPTISSSTPGMSDHGVTDSKTISTITPAPSVRSERPHFLGRSRSAWAFIIAVACGAIGALLIVITLIMRATVPLDPSSPAPRAAEVTVARSADSEEVANASLRPPPDEQQAKSDEPVKSEEVMPASTPTAAAGHLRRHPAPRSTSAFTRLPASNANAPASPVAESSRFGTVRVQQSQDNFMTVVVDGEYHRVKDGSVVVSCGRHKIRVGFREDRVVDVPCGGVVSL